MPYYQPSYWSSATGADTRDLATVTALLMASHCTSALALMPKYLFLSGPKVLDGRTPLPCKVYLSWLLDSRTLSNIGRVRCVLGTDSFLSARLVLANATVV